MTALDNKKPPSRMAKVVFFLYNTEGKKRFIGFIRSCKKIVILLIKFTFNKFARLDIFL